VIDERFAPAVNTLGHALTQEPPDELDAVGFPEGAVETGDLGLWLGNDLTVTVGCAGVETPR
jgi:hypothetical protein